MMNEFLTFARAIDAFCARMNGALTAVAIVLALLVAGMTLIRAEQYLPIAMVNMTLADQPLIQAGWPQSF